MPLITLATHSLTSWSTPSALDDPTVPSDEILNVAVAVPSIVGFASNYS